MLMNGAPLGVWHMSEDVIIFPWLLLAKLNNLDSAFGWRWYLYGFACTLVAWPLITLPTVHAFLLQPRTMSREARQRQRRTDALALLAESSVQSYPTWIAELKRKSPEGIDRRRYVYEKIRPGDSIELIREDADHREHAVAFRHRGVHIG
jgi:hypothetical protein